MIQKEIAVAYELIKDKPRPSQLQGWPKRWVVHFTDGSRLTGSGHAGAGVLNQTDHEEHY